MSVMGIATNAAKWMYRQ